VNKLDNWDPLMSLLISGQGKIRGSRLSISSALIHHDIKIIASVFFRSNIRPPSMRFSHEPGF
jgi:hypothetical protein